MLLKQETVRHGDKVWTVCTANYSEPGDLRYAGTVATETTELNIYGAPIQRIHGAALWNSLETHENFVRQLTETGEIAESPW